MRHSIPKTMQDRPMNKVESEHIPSHILCESTCEEPMQKRRAGRAGLVLRGCKQEDQHESSDGLGKLVLAVVPAWDELVGPGVASGWDFVTSQRIGHKIEGYAIANEAEVLILRSMFRKPALDLVELRRGI